MPLTINCWPSLSGGQSYVNIEYESTSAFDLHNVAITIPLPHNAPPTVNQVGMGEVGPVALISHIQRWRKAAVQVFGGCRLNVAHLAGTLPRMDEAHSSAPPHSVRLATACST